jgi:hypothetical protein
MQRLERRALHGGVVEEQFFPIAGDESKTLVRDQLFDRAFRHNRSDSTNRFENSREPHMIPRPGVSQPAEFKNVIPAYSRQCEMKRFQKNELEPCNRA